MNVIGIYFGLHSITIVETKGKKITNSFTIPRSALSASGVEEKVPEELKIATLIQDLMQKNNILAKDVVLSLSGKDLIIRNFEIPSLPPEELHGAVSFEAKKYIPFKVEELVSDFQLEMDKASRRNLVLFVGIKKDVMDRYASITQQMNLRPSVIEYSAFSILRFVHLFGAGNRGIVGVISTDLQDEDEVHFTILENGFPLFSRDITLVGRPEELVVPGIAKKPDLATVFDKLKTEIRISLDYYDRKLPTKNIERTYLLCPAEHQPALESLLKEMGLTVYYIDAAKIMGTQTPFSLNAIKAYGCALCKTVKTEIKIDLVAAKTRQSKPVKENMTEIDRLFSLVAGLRISIWAILAGAAILGGTVMYAQYRLVPLKKAVTALVEQRPRVDSVNPDSSFDELQGFKTEQNKKIGVLEGLVKRSWFLTEQLNILPRLVPEGVWLTNYQFQRSGDRVELTLQGYAYQNDSDKEIKLINLFAANLKDDPKFSRTMKEVTITAIDRALYEETSVSSFNIICRGDSAGQ